MTRTPLATLLTLLTLTGALLTAPVLVPASSSADEASTASRTTSQPEITVTSPDARVLYGEAFEPSGLLESTVPDDRPLADVEVTLNYVDCLNQECDDVLLYPVATTRTDPTGAFRFSLRPKSSTQYRFTTDEFTRPADDGTGAEDTYEASYSYGSYVTVVGRFSRTHLTPDRSRPRFTLSTRLSPRAVDGSKVQVYAARPGQRLTYRTVVRVPEGSAYLYQAGIGLAPGRWKIQLRYVHSYSDIATGTYATTLDLR